MTGVTEIRPGTYIFNDASMVRLGVATEATTAARVLATVIARPTPERVVFVPGHACSVVNLFDVAHGVEDGHVITELRVAARGAVR